MTFSINGGGIPEFLIEIFCSNAADNECARRACEIEALFVNRVFQLTEFNTKTVEQVTNPHYMHSHTEFEFLDICGPEHISSRTDPRIGDHVTLECCGNDIAQTPYRSKNCF